VQVQNTISKVNPQQQVRLGKKPVKHDARTFKLATYINSTQLPAIPDSYIWNTKVPQWGMMLNDKIGDCTIAAAGHLIMGWQNDLGMSVLSNPDDPNVKTGGGSEINQAQYQYIAYGLLGTGIVLVLYTLLSKK